MIGSALLSSGIFTAMFLWVAPWMVFLVGFPALLFVFLGAYLLWISWHDHLLVILDSKGVTITPPLSRPTEMPWGDITEFRFFSIGAQRGLQICTQKNKPMFPWLSSQPAIYSRNIPLPLQPDDLLKLLRDYKKDAGDICDDEVERIVEHDIGKWQKFGCRLVVAFQVFMLIYLGFTLFGGRLPLPH